VIVLQAAKAIPQSFDSVEVDLTTFLARWNAGDLSVEPELMAHLYPILRTVAKRQLTGFGPVTLQATELANEVFIKLRERGPAQAANNAQFITFCARMLRNLIVDHLRERAAHKRGGEMKRVDIAELSSLVAEEPGELDVDWLKLDRALLALEREDPPSARLVELRYFLGYDNERCAEQLGVSQSSITRMWRFSRAFLADFLNNDTID
jgi:RNA polymerase sigma factor (TIGR02999 family)